MGGAAAEKRNLCCSLFVRISGAAVK